jgi:hypothetical protein
MHTHNSHEHTSLALGAPPYPLQILLAESHCQHKALIVSSVQPEVRAHTHKHILYVRNEACWMNKQGFHHPSDIVMSLQYYSQEDIIGKGILVSVRTQ